MIGFLELVVVELRLDIGDGSVSGFAGLEIDKTHIIDFEGLSDGVFRRWNLQATVES